MTTLSGTGTNLREVARQRDEDIARRDQIVEEIATVISEIEVRFAILRRRCAMTAATANTHALHDALVDLSIAAIAIESDLVGLLKDAQSDFETVANRELGEDV